MSSCDRRAFLIGASALMLPGCGFTPVYAPGGGVETLLGQIALAAPDTRDEYILIRRMEERLGRAGGGQYDLRYTVSVDSDGLGSTSQGSTTRYQIAGTVAYTLTDTATGRVVYRRDTSAFTGYSATGTTISTLAAEQDARRRLMSILADQMVDQLLLWASGRQAAPPR